MEGDLPEVYSGAPEARAGGGPWRIVRIVAGFLLLAVGVVGLFLPVLQGVLMILGGLAILGRDLPWARRITDRLSRFIRRRAERRRMRREQAR